MDSTKWDSFKETVSYAADTAAKKAKELSELAQLRFTLKMKQSELRDCYRKLGQAYYASEKLNEDNGDKLDALLSSIDELKEKIVEIKAAIADVKQQADNSEEEA